MPIKRQPKRATHDAIGRVIGATLPDVNVVHMARNKVWLTENDEPFAELILLDEGACVVVRVSCHCAPSWAAWVTAQLASMCEVQALKEPFIQRHDGQALYGQAASDYWTWYKSKRPLLSARFYTPPS